MCNDRYFHWKIQIKILFFRRLLKHTGPTKLADKFTKQVTVADGNGNADCLSLIVACGDVGRVEVVLRLQVHPNIGGNAEGALQCYMERMNDNGKKKLSLWERAKRMGKVMELAPGFSFDSDSKVKTYV